MRVTAHGRIEMPNGLRVLLVEDSKVLTERLTEAIRQIPEVELIIGKQPPVPELPPQQAQRRFQLVCRRFIAVFAHASCKSVLEIRSNAPTYRRTIPANVSVSRSPVLLPTFHCSRIIDLIGPNTTMSSGCKSAVNDLGINTNSMLCLRQ